jgi:uncharacterized 2Fe-2S/4Fe-4S cluster protein (DUF4445 family)
VKINVNGKKTIEINDAGRTLREILQDEEIYLDAPCGGRGTCGKCVVQFHWGAPEVSKKERKQLSKDQIAAGMRLACCCIPVEDCKISLHADLTEKMQVESGFYMADKSNSPNFAMASQEQTFLHEESFGIAVDLGTTTIAMELVRLSDGAVLQTETMVNHQRMYGADVISRMQASNEGKGEALKNIVWKDIAHGVNRLLDRQGKEERIVERIVIAGNTTMCHLLLGYSCKTLGAAPFTPVDISLTVIPWNGIPWNSIPWSDVSEKNSLANPMLLKTEVVILPGISAFVGADIVAGILGTGIDESEEISMLVDMGTNSEMVIGNENGFLVTSAAAGPAFEGGALSCGMAGVPGAVSHLSLKENGQLNNYETIGKQNAVGICGTGVVDAVSELVRIGLVDENGTLAEPFFNDGFLIAGNVRVTQEDIREIQMAKSAIRAGIETLLQEYGANPAQIKKVYLAGGFGLQMDVGSAAGIGLIPAKLAAKVVPVGNAALEGARRFLCGEKNQRLTDIVAKSKEINLAMHPQFNEWYMQYMFFDT